MDAKPRLGISAGWRSTKQVVYVTNTQVANDPCVRMILCTSSCMNVQGINVSCLRLNVVNSMTLTVDTDTALQCKNMLYVSGGITILHCRIHRLLLVRIWCRSGLTEGAAIRKWKDMFADSSIKRDQVDAVNNEGVSIGKALSASVFPSGCIA